MPDSASRKHDKAKTQTSLLSGAVSGLASCVILQVSDGDNEDPIVSGGVS